MLSSLANTPLLEVRDLTVRFESTAAFDVVRHISFRLQSGKTLCLAGESGSGKSMTALAILGLIPELGRISTGSIKLCGTELTNLSEPDLRQMRGDRIAMIFQEPMTALNPVLRVGNQVAEPLIQHRKISHNEALDQVKELFHLVGLPDPVARMKEYPHQMSGGMRQRAMIAMALACDPDVLLADEPTTALDVTIQGQILDLLKKLTKERGMGMILITHDLGVVAEMADEVAVMYAGMLVEQAAATDFFDHPLHPYAQGLMRSAPTLESLRKGKKPPRLETIPGVVPKPYALPKGCPFRPRCRNAFAKCLDFPQQRVFADIHADHSVCCWLEK